MKMTCKNHIAYSAAYNDLYWWESEFGTITIYCVYIITEGRLSFLAHSLFFNWLFCTPIKLFLMLNKCTKLTTGKLIISFNLLIWVSCIHWEELLDFIIQEWWHLLIKLPEYQKLHSIHIATWVVFNQPLHIETMMVLVSCDILRELDVGAGLQ